MTGEYQRVFHGAVLSSPECSHTRVSVRFAPTAADEKGRMKKLGRAAEKRRSADVIFRGVFRLAHEGQCFGQDCDPYEVAVRELVDIGTTVRQKN